MNVESIYHDFALGVVSEEECVAGTSKNLARVEEIPVEVGETQDALELHCGVCFELMFTACKLQNCTHIFCSSCVHKLRSYHAHGEFPCPMCRQPSMLGVPHQRTRELARLNCLVDMGADRNMVIEESREKSMRFEIHFGNRHRPLTAHRYQWTALVKIVDDTGEDYAADRIIQRVHFDFYDNFSSVVRRVGRDGSVEFIRDRRDTFSYVITVKFLPTLNIPDMTFEANSENGNTGIVPLAISPAKLRATEAKLKELTVAERFAKVKAATELCRWARFIAAIHLA
jgi:hypothetical protein